jgi:hypothetical protein
VQFLLLGANGMIGSRIAVGVTAAGREKPMAGPGRTTGLLWPHRLSEARVERLKRP